MNNKPKICLKIKPSCDILHLALIRKEAKSLMDGDSSDDNTNNLKALIKSVYEVYPLYCYSHRGCAFLCHKKLRM